MPHKAPVAGMFLASRILEQSTCALVGGCIKGVHWGCGLTLSPPQVTTVDNVPSAPVSTKVDIYCMLVKFTTYCMLMGCGKLRTVVYFQKINRR